MNPGAGPWGAGRIALAWAVHFYTACGAVTALVSLCAIAAGRIPEAMWWLYVAVFIDATDGTAARAVKVKQVLPQFDGAKLDDIVDYLTFVLVPIFFLLQTGLLAGTPGVLAAGAAVLASAYRFCSADAKTPDAFFTGFPSYWNIVGLYFYVFELPPAACAAVTGLLVFLVLEPYAINLDLDGLSEPDQLAQIIERGQQRGTLSGRVRAAAHASLLLGALNGTLVEGFVSDRKVPEAETAIAELKEALIDPIRVG